MRKFTLSLLLLGAAFSMNAQDQKYVVFEDNFDWLLPWANALNANGQACGDAIGTNDAASIQRALNNITISENGEDITAYKALQDKGYSLQIKTRTKNLTEEDIKKINKNASNCTFLQRSLENNEATGVYFLFGRPRSSVGLTTPALDKCGDGIKGFTVSFDWCPQRQGTGEYDVTHLSVCVNENTTVGEGRENVPDITVENNAKLEWRHVELKFENYTLLGTDKITIRPGANQWPSNNNTNDNCRYFFRNLKITSDDPKLGDTAVGDIAVDENAPVEYFNLQGVRVADPFKGVYIVRQGSKVSKRIIR